MEDQRSLALIFLGIVAVFALVGFVLLIGKEMDETAMLTLEERLSHGSTPWDTMSANCATPQACVSKVSDCGNGYVLLNIDGWPYSCMKAEQTKNIPPCRRTPFRFGSDPCVNGESIFDTRCICP